MLGLLTYEEKLEYLKENHSEEAVKQLIVTPLDYAMYMEVFDLPKDYLLHVPDIISTMCYYALMRGRVVVCYPDLERLRYKSMRFLVDCELKFVEVRNGGRVDLVYSERRNIGGSDYIDEMTNTTFYVMDMKLFKKLEDIAPESLPYSYTVDKLTYILKTDLRNRGGFQKYGLLI